MAESRTQLEVLERGKLVAAPGSVQEGQVGIGGVRGDGPDAGPGQGEGLHRGLWGEGDGTAQCPSFQTDLGWRCSTKVVLGGIISIFLCFRRLCKCQVSSSTVLNVLVTSPPGLLHLVGQARLTSMDRCCHLVVEEGDSTLPMWHKQVGEIIVSWRKQRNKQEGSSPDHLEMVAER